MNIFSFINNIFFPQGCVFCDRTMEPNREAGSCGECAEYISFCGDNTCCERCGKPIVSFGEKQLCYFCLNKKSKYFDRIVSVFEYDSVVRESILRYKDFGYREYAKLYAKVMVARFYEELGDIDFDFICAPPSSQKRRINHMDEVCRQFSKMTGLEFQKDLIVKIRHTEKQGFLNAEKRMKNLMDSMSIKETNNINGMTVLVIDDVCTTRSTIMECARALKRSGAKRVFSVTLATTLKSD